MRMLRNRKGTMTLAGAGLGAAIIALASVMALQSSPTTESMGFASESSPLPAAACPSDELPSTGAPVRSSVAVYIGGHPACTKSGLLAPIVYSLVDGATGLPPADRPWQSSCWSSTSAPGPRSPS
jgi:hypothetical protein